MKRGDIVLVRFDPAVGAEVAKTRPAIVVSNDRANAASTRNGHGIITLVPLTSNITRIYPFQVRVLSTDETGLGVESKAQAEQVRSLDISRIGETLGRVSPQTLAQIDRALVLHLGLAATTG